VLCEELIRSRTTVSGDSHLSAACLAAPEPPWFRAASARLPCPRRKVTKSPGAVRCLVPRLWQAAGAAVAWLLPQKNKSTGKCTGWTPRSPWIRWVPPVRRQHDCGSLTAPIPTPDHVGAPLAELLPSPELHGLYCTNSHHFAKAPATGQPHEESPRESPTQPPQVTG